MYVNDRDQINYHGFLTALRTMHGYLLKEVSTGVCCESGMNRFEKGNRVAEKLVRDRLTARLGISCEKYEDYLQPKEYVRWEQRLRIINAIEKRNLKVAKKELKKYEEFSNLNRTNQQFVETMHFMILTLDGATQEELYASIKNAVKLTVPNLKKAFAGEHLLSDQEINLILEQMRLEAPKKVIKDEKAWRISEYQKLISYMDNSCWEKLQKAKVYPKVTYYICSQLLSKELSESEIRRGLELCHNAIELLRDTSRVYYFIELTEFRRALATRLMEFGISEEENSQLEEMLNENNQWESVFKELYAEYKVAPYMSDFCFLYYENECHDMVEVIETRRNMLGLSRARLGEGICTERTIIRFEREGVNPSIELVRRLFDKMGMCAEYRRARVITADVNTLMLSIEVGRNVNDYDLNKWEKNLGKLEELLYMNIAHNKQYVIGLKNLLALMKKEITMEEYHMKSMEVLECSLPIKTLKYEKKKYYTREEISWIYNQAFESKGELTEICIKIVRELCEQELKKDISPEKLCVYELLTNGLGSYLGNVGDFLESTEIGMWMLKECLSNRRMDFLSDNLYNNIWNYQEECKKHKHIVDTEFIRKEIEKCITICTILNRPNWISFFQQRLNSN